MLATLTLALAATVARAAPAAQAGTVSAAGRQPGPSTSPHAGWQTKLADAQALARRHGSPYILVDLYADWCGWCKELETKVFSTPRFQQYATDKFVLLRVDTEDRGEGSELQNRYGAGSLPTTLVLTPDLVMAAKVGGFAPVEPFIEKIEAQLALFTKLEKSYPAMLASTDRFAVRGAAEELHQRGDGARAAALYRRLFTLGGMKPEEAAWTAYLLADALYTAGDLAGADAEIARARKHLAADTGAAALRERLDVLAVRIVEKRGSCKERVAALESFLRAHPSSQYSAPARRTLQALKSDGGAECS